MLNVDIDAKKGFLFIRFYGDITYKTRKVLSKDIYNFLNEMGINNVVFNLEKVNKIDEVGFKTLERCYKKCKNSFICGKNFDNFKIINNESEVQWIV